MRIRSSCVLRPVGHSASGLLGLWLLLTAAVWSGLPAPAGAAPVTAPTRDGLDAALSQTSANGFIEFNVSGINFGINNIVITINKQNLTIRGKNESYFTDKIKNLSLNIYDQVSIETIAGINIETIIKNPVNNFNNNLPTLSYLSGNNLTRNISGTSNLNTYKWLELPTNGSGNILCKNQ
ncbi:MAG: hypothetical protein LBU12_03565 [Deltaproteobacteria bacterium]|jgi:hypothetical protein|nr:hypothetical protein [Deltaproteobacteria bacterium]